jgi:hypothetical protein
MAFIKYLLIVAWPTGCWLPELKLVRAWLLGQTSRACTNNMLERCRVTLAGSGGKIVVHVAAPEP